MMNLYGLKSLKEANMLYDSEHGVTFSDVQRVNELIKIIEGSRTVVPQVGDIILYTDKNGYYYENAHIERISDDGLYICEKPYVPFVTKGSYGISTSTSGGAWTYIPCNLKYAGKKKKRFCVWGHGGPQANGAVDFEATVNVWMYDENKGEFSTKDWCRETFFISIDENGNTVYSGDGKEFSKETFENYVSVTKGNVIESPGVDDMITLWRYKSRTVWADSIEEYQSIDGISGMEFCNGIRECKYTYNDKLKLITVHRLPRKEYWKTELDWLENEDKAFNV